MTNPTWKPWIVAPALWILLAACPASGQGTAGQAAAARVVAPAPAATVGLGDRLTLTVEGLASLLARVDDDCKKLLLYLDGLAIDGSPPVSCDRTNGELRFVLGRTQGSDVAWHTLLGKPTSFRREVTASVGTAGGFAVPSNVKIRLEVLPVLEFYLFLLVLLAAVVAFFLLARKSSILRDPNALAGSGPRPYSLARFQMAVWFFLTIAAYAFMWMATGELNTITSSILGLIGISSGTALGSSLVDAGKKQTAGQQVQPPGAQSASLPVKGPASGMFLTDILSDANGITLQRFQMFTWTLVLALIFCISVYEQLAMPQFNATLLGLMGVSSGTYLTFKFPEQFSLPPQAAAGNAAADPPA